MTGLYVFGASSPITRLIRVVPQQDVLQVVNRTLDGRMHVQTIGSPARTLAIELQVDSAGRAIIDELRATAGKITVIHTETDHGHLIEAGPWSQPIRGQYRATITVAL